MPARVHALLVVRPDGRIPADLHLRRTLTALAAQSRPVDALTLVLCGPDDAVRAAAAASGAEGVITADRSTSYAQALRLATHRLDGDAVWLLAQDTVPAPEALARLAGALETAPSVALAAPKLVRWDDHGQIASLGVSMTRLGRTVGLADGELDQGQHDATEDVLGADVRGLLVRVAEWRALGGIDPALSGADEGLDLGVRARLAGGRVALAPTALVAVAGDGVAGPPGGEDFWAHVRRSYASRTAQLHRRLVYAPAAAVPLHWLSLLPLALWRTLGHLLGKQPDRIGSEWAAAVIAMIRLPSVAAARGRIRRARTAGWAQLAPLRVTTAQLRHRLDDDGDTGDHHDLRFFTGGGAWLVLAALVLSAVALPSLLAWPVLGGGALAPLRSTLAQLWEDAAWGQRPLGWDLVGPADPFSGLVALVGSLSPWEPSRAVVVLWILALPLATLGGWFAATRVTRRSTLRALGAVAWALAPAFLAALVDGRPTGVLVHLLLPWLFYTGVAAHRSWTSAGVASLLLAAVIACAPSLAPGLGVLWLIAVVLTVVLRGGRGLPHVVWLIVPTVVLFAPLVWHRLRAGDAGSLLADPGVPLDTGGAADVLRRLLLTAGFPTADPGGWNALLGDAAPVWWVPLLTVPLLVLALLAPLTARLTASLTTLLVAALGLATAFAAVGVTLSASGSDAVGLWPGAALSLAWAGFLGAALLTLDLLPGIRFARLVAAAVIMVALGAAAFPALTATVRGTAALTNGPASTLPAYVDAEGRGGTSNGTLVIVPQPDGGIAASVVWGGSATLGGQTTLLSARTTADAADVTTARMAADLITDAAGDVVDRLADHGIAFVVLGTTADGDADGARAMRLSAQTALDKRSGVDIVGETAKGTLWRLSGEVSARSASAETVATARRVAAVQLGVVAVALLLALPTSASRREGRGLPRVVGTSRAERR